MATNNVAEYSGLIAGLEKAVELDVDDLEVSIGLGADGEADARRVPGERTKPCKSLSLEAGRLGRLLESVAYHHVMREQNELADRLVNEALDAG